MMPAAARSRPSILGLRPVATRRWLPSIVSSPAVPFTTTRTFGPADSTRGISTPHRTAIPSRASCSSTISAHSGSSSASGRDVSSTVTSAPRRRKACASSSPTGPAPMTIRWSGHRVRSKIVSLVRCGVSGRPGIGGIAGEEPVAITKRRAAISIPSPTATVRASLKRAAPSITRTPSPVKRSLESFGAIAAMTPWTWSRTLAKSTAGRCAITPNGAARRGASARRAAASSAFDGTQPVLRQSPPILPFSTSTTGTPNAAAAAATDNPPDPAPMTQMSVLISSVTTPSPSRGDPVVQPTGSTPGPAGIHPPDRDGNEGEQAQCHESADKPRRCERRHVECEAAIGASGFRRTRDTRLLREDHAIEAVTHERERGRPGDDAECGCREEGAQGHADQGGREIDQRERKQRHQPQEQQVAEGIGAEPFHDPRQARARPGG